MDQTPHSRILTRWSALKSERSSWQDHWREISEYLLPRSGRFLVADRNRGEKRHNHIYDSTGTRALRVLAAGMMAGMTSPARPWFRLGTADPEMMAHEPVKVWLHDVTRLMLDVFASSNTYRALHSIYEELGAFGTAATIVADDFDSVIHHHTLTVGEYAVAADHRGGIGTLYREFELTVGQMVEWFGRDKVSLTARNLYDRNSLDTWLPVVHAIEPRHDRDAAKRDNLNMAWKSVYLEPGERDGRYLSESGFEQFPALVPRWSVAGGDIYGNSPAMEALGDIKQLQHEQLRKAQGIDFMTKPPLQAPTALKNAGVNTLPGGVSYVDLASPTGGIRSAFEVRLDLQHLLYDIQDVRERINGAFYADLFLMLANSDRTRMTATEVAERHEEKLLMLGPVLERLHNELLDPFIEMTFARLVRAGALPPPPPELQGMDINVEFVSMLAQAQRAVGTNSVDRYVGNLGAIAQMKPDVLDRFDADAWAEIYADMLGVDPRLIVADDQVALIREQRAQAAAQQQQAEQMSQQAQTARNLAAADMSGDNALTNVVQMFSGYNT
ncbi:portal protein [Pseudothauera rhizosphaerae]|uniref:Phage head-tail adapter protein n=1 Tax=Pseudothauera rhizosphaerae TaxID=2565932 RepID=A0A4S4AWB2_9RHOO|nr:portal protein [Pseudothauera rhizosphaerae]THF64322.1 phage head-tail adapter protein [Pseudothauera rhizosphaerae]